MKVIVDTCVWSFALRRNCEQQHAAIVKKLTELIDAFLVQMIGPVRQELLSGISSPEQFNTLRQYLSAFDDLALTREDYELAAELYNTCRKKGVQGSNTDFLICATAIHHQLAIFTVDNDFVNFSNHIPISLLQ